MPNAATPIAEHPELLPVRADGGVVIASHVLLVPPTAFDTFGPRAQLDRASVVIARRRRGQRNGPLQQPQRAVLGLEPFAAPGLSRLSVQLRPRFLRAVL